MLDVHYPHLVLLPGLVNDSRLWQHQVTGLEDVARVTVGDLTKSDSIAEMAASVLASVPAQTFALGGLSMGGYVALEIMRQAPERVMGLALLDTNARSDTPEAAANRLAAIRLAETEYDKIIMQLMSKQLNATHLEDEVMVGLVTDMAMNLGCKTFIRQQQAIMERVDSRPLLRSIECPTLILCGRDDEITPIDVHQEMNTHIKNSDLVILDNCGHLSAVEQPSRVNEALIAWLSKIG
jgi:pimeloyl-ACP methyl ester carboxylesterase